MKNIKLVKYFVETLGLNIQFISSINAGFLYNEINSTSSELKENYINIEVYPIIVASLAGDLEIFKYFVSKGASINVTGFITLSKNKLKACFSNILGAACLQSNFSLIKHFRKNFKSTLNVNEYTTEKYIRNKALKLKLEPSIYSNLHLVCLSPSKINSSDSIECVNELLKFDNVNINALYSEGNTVIHLLVRENKLELLNAIVDKFKTNLSILNNEGLNPIALAHKEGKSAFIDALSKYEEKFSSDRLLESLEPPIKSKNKTKPKEESLKGVQHITDQSMEITISSLKENKKQILKSDEKNESNHTIDIKILNNSSKMTSKQKKAKKQEKEPIRNAIVYSDDTKPTVNEITRTIFENLDVTTSQFEIERTFPYLLHNPTEENAYIELLKSYESLKQENLQLKHLIFDLRIKELQNNETDEINDILELSNLQLDRKCKELNELKNKNENGDHSNMDDLDKTALKKLLNQYSAKLEEINRRLLKN